MLVSQYVRPYAYAVQGEMRDPVLAADGHSYEREAIELWLQENDHSAVTGSRLKHKRLIPNVLIRKCIAFSHELQ